MPANLFMHNAFDTWLAHEFPSVEFERYADLCRARHRRHNRRIAIIALDATTVAAQRGRAARPAPDLAPVRGGRPK